MRNGHIETKTRLWWRWLASCVVGWFLGFLVGFIFAGSFEGIIGTGPVQGALGYTALGLFVGAGLGFMQWRILRQHLAGVASWIAASAVGLGIAGGVGYSVAVLILGYSEDIVSVSAVLGWTITAGIGGVIAGLWQQRVLTRDGNDSHGWMLTSTLGWALSFAAFGTAAIVSDRVLRPVLPGIEGVDFFVALIVGGVVLGAVTATAACKILGDRLPGSLDKPAHV